MSAKNRELSQFGSFLEINNSNKKIGITTEPTPYVGIGTTNPQVKLDVLGDANISGIISATGYYLDGNPLVSAEVSSWIISGADIYRNTGNVGIGTTIPTEKLEVIGNIKASGTITGENLGVSGIITSTKFVSTVTTGTSPIEVSSQTLVTNLNADLLRGKTPPSGTIVGTDDNQELTNKTINLSNNSLTGTISSFNAALSDADFATLAGTETLTNKTLTTPIISGIRPSAGQLQTIPSGTGTIISTNSVSVITTGMIVDGTITNADISATAGIETGKLSAFRISNIPLGSNLNNLTAGSFITFSSGTTYNGSTPITVSAAATSTTNTANTLVARNASGDFTAGTIEATAFNATGADAFRINGTAVINSGRNLISIVNGSFSGVVTATDFNSTSDINLKTNINTVTNPLETINSLRGVTFNWKESGSSSIGVIAQELQEVLPELVSDGEIKSVNYNGLIGILIEAVKELSQEVQELKNK